jgi:hypothetical protein
MHQYALFGFTLSTKYQADLPLCGAVFNTLRGQRWGSWRRKKSPGGIEADASGANKNQLVQSVFSVRG